MKLRCVACGAVRLADGATLECPACDGLLEVVVEPLPRRPRWEGRGVWRYARVLPAGGERVTLGEGATPLYPCPRAAKALGLRSLWVKFEGANPTGSFKDRGMTVGVTLAKRLGRRVVACASTGNTAASMAAYAARAGLRAIVLLPEGHVAAGKVAQAAVHGARLIQVRGNFDAAMALVRELAREGEAYLLNSLNPYRLEGQKTLAFEVCEALGGPPDAVVLPVGNGGNVSAIWKGFREWRSMGLATRLPRMIGVQAAGAAPVARAMARGGPLRPVRSPRTLATAIRIGDPVNAPKVFDALRSSGGWAATVTDREILAAQRWFAETEGLFVEPASAAPIAYLRRGAKTLRRARTIVAVATGHGLKDPDAVTSRMPRLRTVTPSLPALRRAMR